MPFPVYNSGGTVQATPHSVIGRFTATGTTAAVTLTGSAVFTSSTSYQCVATDDNTGSVGLTYTDGSHFTVTAVANNDVISVICMGT